MTVDPLGASEMAVEGWARPCKPWVLAVYDTGIMGRAGPGARCA